MNEQQVTRLMNEAAAAGDTQTVRDCETILAGDEDHACFRRVLAILENAQAQQD